MHYEISYKGDNSDRRAINDWVGWMGMKRAKLLIAFVKQGGTWKQFDFYCGFAGVSGKPNIATFEHFAGRKLTDEDWGE